MIRLRVSRPRWSVPSGWAHDGGWRVAAYDAWSGSYGARSGAATPTTLISRRTRALAAPSGECPPNRRSSPPKPCASIASTSSGVVRRPAPRVAVTSDTSLVPDARVEPGVAEVDQQVHQREDHAVEQHEVLDHGPVALAEGLHERHP